jgi:hypothetical protein
MWPFAQPQRQTAASDFPSATRTVCFAFLVSLRAASADAAATQLKGVTRAAPNQAVRWVEYWRLMTVKDGASHFRPR